MPAMQLPTYLIDTHAHLAYEAFAQDIDSVMARAQQAQVQGMVLPATDLEGLQATWDLHARYPQLLRPLLGLHPCAVSPHYTQQLDTLQAYLDKRPCYGIGEIGIDLYHASAAPLDTQKHVFLAQVQWALARNLPIVIHCREAFFEVIEVLQEALRSCPAQKLRGIWHCFSGTHQQAQQIRKLGLLLGIGGLVTFTNCTLAQELRHIPLQDLVLETDSPYLTPTPHRGKRNEPCYLQHIAACLVDVYGVSFAEVASITSGNARSLFFA